jgi:hypothetical protein
MAFSDIALLSSDNDFILRTRACVSTEGERDPVTWTSENIWQMAGMPGFGDKYASALANGVARPGNDQSVISDPDILSAVQSLRSEPDASLPDDESS